MQLSVAILAVALLLGFCSACAVDRVDIIIKSATYFDDDNDNMISTQELEKYWDAMLTSTEKMFANAAPWVKTVPQILDRCDWDRDGAISMKDFIRSNATCLNTCEKLEIMDGKIFARAEKTFLYSGDESTAKFYRARMNYKTKLFHALLARITAPCSSTTPGSTGLKLDLRIVKCDTSNNFELEHASLKIGKLAWHRECWAFARYSEQRESKESEIKSAKRTIELLDMQKETLKSEIQKIKKKIEDVKDDKEAYLGEISMMEEEYNQWLQNYKELGLGDGGDTDWKKRKIV